jgi:hypothetical protein
LKEQIKEVLKQSFSNDNYVKIGKKRVRVEKITFEKWVVLREVLDKLPGLVIQVWLSRGEHFYQTVYAAIDVAFEEIIQVISILSGIDEEYLKKNAGIDEVFNYFVKTAKKNDFYNIIKNGQSLLQNLNPQEDQEKK